MDRRDDYVDNRRKIRDCQRKKRRRRFERQMRNLRYDTPKLLIILVAAILAVLFFVIMIIGISSHKNKEPKDTQTTEIQLDTESTQTALQEGTETTETEAETESETASETEAPAVGIGYTYPDEDGWYTLGETKVLDGFTAGRTENTKWPSESEVDSQYAVLIDESTNEILVGKNEDTVMNPASMTKILTVLVAAEHITDLDDTFTITFEITDYSFANGCSCVGFEVGEEVTVRDLFYGTILPSGADAALALAIYTAGSQEAFVELMNEKIDELGLSDTAHFTNCVGLYDEDHYCTVTDMAMMLKAAIENDFCREVLQAHVYTTSATEQHPEGLIISNWFLRRIEDRDSHGEVLCAKTGYVDESRFCAASYFVSNEGKPYIAVTASTGSNKQAIADHVALYSRYACPE